MILSPFTRVWDGATGFLGSAPRALAGVLDDIRDISEQMRRMVELVSHLPDLNAHLASIDKQVDDLNAVLIEELRQVTLAVHPLRRTRARFGRAGRAAKPDADAS